MQSFEICFFVFFFFFFFFFFFVFLHALSLFVCSIYSRCDYR